MKVITAIIELEDRVINFDEMPLNELGHALLKLCEPTTPIRVPEETLKQWRSDAQLDFVRQPIQRSSCDCHIDLYMRKQMEIYQTIERVKLSQHELIHAYSKKV